MMGYLIVFEGIDGSGKTTVAKKLLEKLSELGYKAHYTYEPWESPFSKLLQSFKGKVSPLIEALLLAADRYYHVTNDIVPKLKEGYVVLLDRYFYSSIAYQGARGADPSWVKELNRYVVKPDLIIYLDVALDIALNRLKGKGSKWGYFEKTELLIKVKEIYESMIESEGFIVVDANRSLNEVVDECFNIIVKKLSELESN